MIGLTVRWGKSTWDFSASHSMDLVTQLDEFALQPSVSRLCVTFGLLLTCCTVYDSIQSRPISHITSQFIFHPFITHEFLLTVFSSFIQVVLTRFDTTLVLFFPGRSNNSSDLLVILRPLGHLSPRSI